MEQANLEQASLEQTFAGVEASADKKNEEKKQFLKGLKQDLQQKIMDDPEFVKRMHSMSDSLEVTFTLGAGTKGNVIHDKEKSTEGNRVLAYTSSIVGYEIKNVGTEPITYYTQVWAPAESGKWEGTEVQRTLEPGATACLTRKYFSMLTARPEFTFTLANGKVVSNLKKHENTDEMLSSFYFSFSDDRLVNDDKVKKAVDEEGPDGNRVVKPEYAEVFGYLNNPKVRNTRGAGKKAKLTIQDVMANYVNSLINGQ